MFTVKLPYTNQEVTTSLFTFKHIKGLMNSVEDIDIDNFDYGLDSYKEVQTQINAILKQVIMDENFNVDGMSYYDRDYLFMKILLASDDLELNYIIPCEGEKVDEDGETVTCGVQVEHKSIVEKVFLDKPKELKDIEMDVLGVKYIIKLKSCTTTENMDSLLNWVDTITIDGNLLNVKSNDDLEELLVIKLYNKLFYTVTEFINNYNILNLASEKTCHRCGHLNKSNENYTNLAFFLKLYL